MTTYRISPEQKARIARLLRWYGEPEDKALHQTLSGRNITLVITDEIHTHETMGRTFDNEHKT